MGADEDARPKILWVDAKENMYDDCVGTSELARIAHLPLFCAMYRATSGVALMPSWNACAIISEYELRLMMWGSILEYKHATVCTPYQISECYGYCVLEIYMYLLGPWRTSIRVFLVQIVENCETQLSSLTCT